MTKLLSSVLALSLASAVAAQEESVSSGDTPAPATTGVEVPVADVVSEAPPDPPALLVIDAATTTLEEFLWTNRLIVVFADTPADPRFREQIELLTAWPDALIERDVVVITDTDPAARTSVRLALRPRGFQLALLAKDGKVNLRKPFPWDVREITHAIDKWPLRQQEMRARTGGE